VTACSGLSPDFLHGGKWKNDNLRLKF